MKQIKSNSIDRILVDVGSSTLKVYKNGSSPLKLVLSKSIPFKNDFDSEVGLSELNKKELFNTFSDIKNNYKNHLIKIYATALYRKLNSSAKSKLVDDFFRETGLHFNIIDADLENHYLETALVEKCDISEPVLLINIGGGSTELVIIEKSKVMGRENIDIGVGTINTKFAGINNQISEVSLKTVCSFVKKILPELKFRPRIAFYTGGELTYMKLAGFKLADNYLFNDPDHRFMVKTVDFKKRNQEIFNKVRLEELEKLLPDNPTWMHGARGCSAIAQAICESYGIKMLIPSDSNLINGVVRKEFRKVTLSGSFRKHLNYILNIRKLLIENKIEVLSPRFTEPKNPREEFVVFGGEENLSPLELERHHLESISNSDALIVCDPEGYVGASALIEIGFAHSLGKRIIFTEKPEEFMLNTLPAEVGL